MSLVQVRKIDMPDSGAVLGSVITVKNPIPHDREHKFMVTQTADEEPRLWVVCMEDEICFWAYSGEVKLWTA